MKAALERTESVGSEAPRRARPRVLLLIWAGVLRGAERHVFDLAVSLPDHGYQPTVCFFARAESYGPLLREVGVEFVELDNRSTKFDLRGVVRFVRLLRHGNFDLVHDHGVALWARVVVRIAAPSVPLVYTEHVTRFTWLRRVVYKLLSQLTDAHVAVSAAARDALVRQLGVEESSVTVISNSVNADRFKEMSDESVLAFRRTLGLPLESMVLTSVGRLSVTKQFDLLIRWLSPLLVRRPDVHLMIVGEGEERHALEAQIGAASLSGQVHLLGNRLDVPDILGASDLFVFSSREESFGIAVAESMLARKAVVALRIAGVEEVVEASVTGILVEQERASVEFVIAVEELLDDPTRRKAFGDHGHDRALALFGPDSMVSGLARLYDSLLPSSVESAT